MSGMRKAPPISISSPRETSTSRFSASAAYFELVQRRIDEAQRISGTVQEDRARLAMIPVEKVAGFAVDAVRVPLLKVFGVDAPRRYYMGELPAAAKAYFGSFPKGAKSAWQVMKNGMNAAELEDRKSVV